MSIKCTETGFKESNCLSLDLLEHKVDKVWSVSTFVAWSITGDFLFAKFFLKEILLYNSICAIGYIKSGLTRVWRRRVTNPKVPKMHRYSVPFPDRRKMQTKHILTSDFFKTKKQTHSHKTKHILTLQHLIPLRQIHKTTEWELKVYGTDFHFQT